MTNFFRCSCSKTFRPSIADDIHAMHRIRLLRSTIQVNFWWRVCMSFGLTFCSIEIFSISVSFYFFLFLFWLLFHIFPCNFEPWTSILSYFFFFTHIILIVSSFFLFTLSFEIVPPRWIQEPQDIALMLGNAIVINCEAEGYPEPEITWFKGGKSFLIWYHYYFSIHCILSNAGFLFRSEYEIIKTFFFLPCFISSIFSSLCMLWWCSILLFSFYLVHIILINLPSTISITWIHDAGCRGKIIQGI